MSFFPTKNVGALGDAGLVTTNDDDLTRTLRALRVHGASAKNEHALVGGNFRIDALQAALLRVKLRRLDEITRARRAIAARYDALLANVAHVQIPARCGESHAFNQYVIASPSRDALRVHLEAENVETATYYATPLHRQSCFTSLEPVDLPVTDHAARTSLALPIFPGLREDEIERVARAVASFQEPSTIARMR
jgi:dTDP-4-amino-4,6-dideoxygalactose transaminase